VKSSRRVLDTHDRASEVLFGLIMVLTFTGSLSVAEAGRDDVRAMWIGALGCNLAWGIIDGILYWMGCIAERGNSLNVHRAVRRNADPESGARIVAGALPEWVASVLLPAELRSIHERLLKTPEPPAQARLSRGDWLGGIGVFLLVFASTFPVVVPFLVLEHVPAAMRTSNAIAVVMLFLTGYVYGKVTSRQPWVLGMAMVLLGSVLVGMTIALGG
jgi:hypothetical protein